MGHNVLLQDNTSTIRLATNGKISSSKKTKHIRQTSSEWKGSVELGDVGIKYKPTRNMWCDVLTKPKQGSILRKFKDNLMKIPQEYDDDAEHLRTHPLLLQKKRRK